MHFPFEVELDMEELAEQIGHSTGRLGGIPYQQVIEFIMHIDAMIADCDFTEPLIKRLEESLDLEE